MEIFKSKEKKIPGTDFKEVHYSASLFYSRIRKKSKRRVHIRSAYFNKDKVFLDLFWHHLFQKDNWRDRVRRLKFLPCAIDLIKNSYIHPTSKENPNKNQEILHRFIGYSFENEMFYVQIKENKKTGQKFLVSIFPA